MIIRKCTLDHASQALDAIRAKYGYNLKFKRFEDYSGPRSTRVKIQLGVESSSAKGSRISASWSGNGRRVAAACWHAYGDFFDALLAINPEAVICVGGRQITTAGGNWEDRNIGAPVAPMMYSEACDCLHGIEGFSAPHTAEEVA